MQHPQPSVSAGRCVTFQSSGVGASFLAPLRRRRTMPASRKQHSSCRCTCSAIPLTSKPSPSPSIDPALYRQQQQLLLSRRSSPPAEGSHTATSYISHHIQLNHQRQQHHANQYPTSSSPLPSSTPSGPPPPPLAALTRMLLTGPNTQHLRSLAQRRAARAGGPISLLLFLLTLVAAMLAAMRGAIVRKVKACRTCRGFGVTRCRLCAGSGRVDWAAKMSHYDVCPLCATRRFVVCTDCGGMYHRPLFSHLRRGPRRAQEVTDYLYAGGAADYQYERSPLDGMQEGISSARND